MGQEPRNSSRLLLGAGLPSSLRVGEGAFPPPPPAIVLDVPSLPYAGPSETLWQGSGWGTQVCTGLPSAGPGSRSAWKGCIRLWPGSLELGPGQGCMGSPGLAWGAGVAESTLSP